MKRILSISAYVVAGALLCSCSVERFLPDGASALVKNTVEVDGGQVKSAELVPYVIQQSQKPSLWKKADNVVVFNKDLVDESEDNIKSHLEYLGYYGSKVTSSVTTDKRKSRVTYTVHPGRRIKIREIHYSVPEAGTFASDFYADTSRATVRPGMFLSEAALEDETERSASYLRTKGYYGFSKNHYFAEADTLSVPGEAILDIDVRGYTRNESPLDGKVPVRFRIGDVSISHSEDLPFRENLLQDINTVRPGALYNEIDIKNTYNRLSALKVFNSVNIEMTPASDSIVDCRITLNESKLKSVKVNLEASTNSSGLIGISPRVTYSNKNIFHGGEWLNIGFMGNFQFKLNDNTRANELGVSASLSLPRFLGLPYSHFKGSDIPRTEINASYSYQNRPEYTRNIASVSYGYTGIIDGKLSYKFNPISISFVRLFNLDPEFIKIMDINPFIKYAYQDHLDAGGFSTLYWASTLDVNPNVTFRYLRFNFDLSGNILSLFNNAMKISGTGEKLILGVPYAQYLKGELTLGKTWRFGKENGQAIAARILAGAGYAYGNSSVLPFEKQFYCGGAGSMRGWQSRSLGPGSVPQSKVFMIPSQTGDLKFEANLEYRFFMFWKLGGAVFADVGNVWTVDRPGADPNGVFRIKDFYRTLGSDWGIGLRCDLGFIVVRIDYGMQLFDPVGEGRWVNPGEWFKGASAVHFGVGYPF